MGFLYTSVYSSRGCSVEHVTMDTEDTSLHLAARWGHCTTVKYLLEHGANGAGFNSMRCTPLDLAIGNIYICYCHYNETRSRFKI